MISLVTVPNTGTIYTIHLLREWGVKMERKHLTNTDPPPMGDFRFGPGFPCASSDYWATYPDTRRVVCTLRDPMLAVISAINRRVPDRMISVDGWAVMAEWHSGWSQNIHFFTIPPTHAGFTNLARFVGALNGFMNEADIVPMNTSEDPDGLKRAYVDNGIIPEHPTVQRALEQLAEMPLVWALFHDHGIALPWFRRLA